MRELSHADPGVFKIRKPGKYKQFSLKNKHKSGPSEMAPWVKTLAAEPDSLNSVPRSLRCRREQNPIYYLLSSIQACLRTTYTDTKYISKCI